MLTNWKNISYLPFNYHNYFLMLSRIPAEIFWMNLKFYLLDVSKPRGNNVNKESLSKDLNF